MVNGLVSHMLMCVCVCVCVLGSNLNAQAKPEKRRLSRDTNDI